MRKEGIILQLKDLMHVALFAAVVGILAFFPPILLPIIPVPITAQTFGVMLAGSLLGARKGFLSLTVFIILVAAGAPLIAGGRGGLGVLIGPGGGYIFSWPLAALLIGYVTEKCGEHITFPKALFANLFGGIIVIYLIGVTYLSLLSETPWLTAFFSSFIFLPGDMTKAIIASLLAVRIRRAYPTLAK